MAHDYRPRSGRSPASLGAAMTLTRRWFALFFAGGVPFLFLDRDPGLVVITLVWNGVLLVATLADYLLLPRSEELQVERIVDSHLSLAARNQVQLILRSTHSWPWRVLIKEEPPQGMPS